VNGLSNRGSGQFLAIFEILGKISKENYLVDDFTLKTLFDFPRENIIY
jgi:hypothetical protein